MNQGDQEKKINNSHEISVKDILMNIHSAIRFLKSKWLVILICAILGGATGLIYSIFKKPQYRAVYTFVLEENEKGGLGQYANLASIAGIDLGSGGGDIFQGENILELYKSRTMIETALLSTAVFNGKTQKLIDRYVEFNKLRKKWDEKAQLKGINFNGDPAHFNRQQDSIIIDLVLKFNNEVLSVVKPDKKLSIIEVNVFSHDELFAKEFADNIVSTVNSFYVQTKTKKLLQNVGVMQKQADSVKSVLNKSISGVAEAVDASPNANPLMSVLRTSSQKKQVDVQASTAIYAELVKNLELSKIQLRKETPLIQAIDMPLLPLFVSKLGKIKAIIIGFILAMFLSACWLLFKKLLASFKWK
ncbi:Wzz/FepE/Etk N-terminal domain-containing protein [Mucilaginibacter gotjawali]|uniref:Uncharacterized protein n=2 Tax=Mucilaginibacter gotjawali TaxID=1550579 RepID=A0A839SME5_9SPHI|nr:Wzz/FepE/Etk N-terminal domain-containing protein [Mucilaginibacter gotjawali]MBB3058523.1 hypothetical protein [Mucilaginibacter gotjawali]BAU55747.1 Chain length determinant protein [Mucilaginibacter gotjawali]